MHEQEEQKDQVFHTQTSHLSTGYALKSGKELLVEMDTVVDQLVNTLGLSRSLAYACLVKHDFKMYEVVPKYDEQWLLNEFQFNIEQIR